ncbi:DNA polymerase Y family protein [uncultured Aliiroseovarius sp.]|uniref:Y-family DNA polymerase n=1 Tax=uncultured Aliiroseovarius sp. TaxID=1658783 RepID=UPI00262A4926|nr:DNA polymerase Y family protein [uncultured Aliiroseovarius sp.]
MSAGQDRRVMCIWFPRLASDRVLRARAIEGPFALVHKQNNTDRIYCLNKVATDMGLSQGMTFSDARAFCPDLSSRPATPEDDKRFLYTLRRWATRYCPWVGLEENGLVLDVTGSSHLAGGEQDMLADIRARLTRAGLCVQLGLADTRGAAWALAHHGGGIAAPGDHAHLRTLPVAALRLADPNCVALQRAGLRRIGDIMDHPRAPLARRFGQELMIRLDQLLGTQPENISPLADPPHYGVRMTLPDPIGLTADVMAAIGRLLDRLCAQLKAHAAGTRVLRLTLRRVDQEAQDVELRLARPLRDAGRILPLFERGIKEVDAGYGIDQIRLEAVQVEPLPSEQITHVGGHSQNGLDDLITRIGSRVGLERIQRLLPADSHIPERSFLIAPAAYSTAQGVWVPPRPRPLRLFSPEPISAYGPRPPERFRWRRMALTTGQASGPERITPEWWFDDPNWRSGLRDYWRIETRQGRRLWIFHTPQDPGWFVQGEFA